MAEQVLNNEAARRASWRLCKAGRHGEAGIEGGGGGEWGKEEEEEVQRHGGQTSSITSNWK